MILSVCGLFANHDLHFCSNICEIVSVEHFKIDNIWTRTEQKHMEALFYMSKKKR